MDAESRRVPLADAVPPNEIGAAVEALSEEDNYRLRAAGRALARKLGSQRQGRDEEDLISEAIVRLLDGRRRWRRGTDFVKFLAHAMKSVASEWRTKGGANRPESVPIEADMLETPIGGSRIEERLAAKMELAEIEDELQNDENVLLVLEARKDGLVKPSEIREACGLTVDEYQAAWRRLTRYAVRRGR